MGNRNIMPLFNDRCPDDVIHLIFMRVDILTLSSCPRVCRQFARVLRSPYFWNARSKAPPWKLKLDAENHREIIHQLTMIPERKEITKYALDQKFCRRYAIGGRRYKGRFLPLCFETANRDGAIFAQSIGLHVQICPDYINVKMCERCQSADIRGNNYILCSTCNHISTRWHVKRVDFDTYIISKPPDYQFPY